MRDMHGNTVGASLAMVVRSEFKTLDPAPIPIVDVDLFAKVTVVVCVYNRPEVARPCLQAFHSRTHKNVNLIVVNDGSDDYTAAVLEKEVQAMVADGRANATVLHNATNLKYTRSINRGFQYAFGQFQPLVRMSSTPAEWALALNSDTLVTPGWLERMLRGAYTRPRIGIVCPYMSNAALLTLPLAPGTSYLETAERVAAIGSRHCPPAVTPVGACMMVRRALWLELGGAFDVERSPEGYGEECEFWARAVDGDTERARRPPGSLPWGAIVADDAHILHESHASFGPSATAREHDAVERFKKEWGDLINIHFNLAKRADPLPQLRNDVCWVRVPNNRPKVYFYTHGVVLCGGILALVNICNRLVERGIDATILYTRDDFGDMARMPLRVAPIRVEDVSVDDWLKLGGCEEGLVFATSWGTGEFVTRFCNRWKGLKPGAFVQDREDLFMLGDGRLQFLHRRDFQPYLDLVKKRSVVNSAWVSDSMVTDFGVCPNFYIPIGVDTDLFYPPATRPKDIIKVLTFSRPSTPRRGYGLMASIYRTLKRRYGDMIELYTYDQTPQPDVPAIHLGKLPQRRLADFMRGCHILLEPSSTQGWGMPAQEFMATGGCVVSTDNGGIHNYGTHNVDCLIAPHVFDSVLSTIYRAIEDPALRERLGMAARTRMHDFTWEKVTDAWAQAIQKLTKEPA